MTRTSSDAPPAASGAAAGSRPTGIDVVGQAPWGTHFCQFYATKADLADVLVPYFKAGLEADEFCMWVTSPPLGVDDAWEALARAVPDVDSYRERGRIEILPHTDWYLLGGRFDQDRVLEGLGREAGRRAGARLRRAAAHREHLLAGEVGLAELRRLRGRDRWRAGAVPDARALHLLGRSLRRLGDRGRDPESPVRAHEAATGKWEVFESFDRRRMQDALAAERERLAVTLHSIGDAVIATDTEGRITTLNRAAEELTGWGNADAGGRPVGEVFRIVSERTGAEVEDPVRAVMQRNAVVGLANHVALVRRDGRRVPIADSAAPIRGPSGATLGVVLVFRDVTAERRAEEALRDSEQRVRLKLESILSPEGDMGALELTDILDVRALQSLMDEFYKLTRVPMAVIDVKGKVLVGVGWSEICTRFHRVHPETCRHCIESDTELTAGVPEGEFKLYKCKNNMWDVATPLIVGGHHVGNVFTGQFFFDDEHPDQALFEAQAARYGFDGAEYLAALRAVPRVSRETVNVAMAFFLRLSAMLSQLSYSNVHLAHSIAERERLMRSLRESKERLEFADRRKDEFLAMLSHELRNPLAPIRNSIYVLERATPGSDKAVRSREVLRRQAEHLTRLVDDLLDVTRISRGKIELQRKRVDLRDIVRKTTDDLRSQFDQSGVALRVEHPAGPVWVEADATRLAQVLGNLLHNAVKFTPGGGTVQVGVAARGGRAELRVWDDGIGMEPGQVERMFEPFAQADHAPGASKGGLGLGLALVKGLVELHGGSVRGRSEGMGRGSEFVITLPQTGPEVSSAAAQGLAAGGARRNVLVIEDNPDVGQSVADMLELQGHTVRVARDGRSGIDLAREFRPDVVLCDIGLPDLDGYQVARTLRRDDALRATRLIALSGFAQAEDRRRAREAGFDGHIAKPPDPEQLVNAIGDGAGGELG